MLFFHGDFRMNLGLFTLNGNVVQHELTFFGSFPQVIPLICIQMEDIEIIKLADIRTIVFQRHLPFHCNEPALILILVLLNFPGLSAGIILLSFGRHWNHWFETLLTFPWHWTWEACTQWHWDFQAFLPEPTSLRLRTTNVVFVAMINGYLWNW